MPLRVGSIELFAGPLVLGAPDDLEAAVVGFLDGAVSSLEIAVQEIDSKPVGMAIIAAKARGVRVRVIVEGGYLVEKKALADPWVLAGEFEANRVILGALLRAGIDVVTDLNPDIFHQKFVVRDRTGASAAVLTGSTNFTATDTGTNTAAGAAGGNNLNSVVVFHDKAVAARFHDEFERLRSGTFGELHERHEPRPAELRLGGVRVKPLFAPRHGPEMEIMKQMLKASATVDFAMFTFSRSSGIDDTMGRLVPSLGRIRGVLDREQGSQEWAATQPLSAAGVQLFENAPGNGVRKVHHKLMVIDSRLTILGSFNYTEPATTLNDENLVVIGNLEETDATAERAQRQIAGFALAEIERIISDLSRPVAARRR